ncbi:RING/FYVE/PHD zinc finger superfamily protein, partial [Striga asiatica]
MSQTSTPAFVYQRKSPHKDPISLSETEPPDGVKPNNGTSQPSTSSTMSRNFTPNFVYQRRSPRKDSICISENEPPDGVKVKPNNRISQLSTSSTMSRNITPTFVYQSKRLHKDPVSISDTELLPNGISQLSTSSSMSREAPTFVYRRKRPHKDPCSTVEIDPPNNGTKPSVGCRSAVSSEKEFANRYDNRKESSFGRALMMSDDVDRVANGNENCSSSKSNLELSSASLKFNMDDSGECSSSGALIGEKSMEEISARDLCISILRGQGLLDRALSKQNRAFNKNISKKYCLRPCRVCNRVKSTQHMLICDNCEGAFHVSCCNPHITVLPAGEWLCSSCLKKKHKILKDKSSSNSTNIGNEIGRKRCLVSEGEFGSLEFMFRDTEPYMSNVRVGDDFQASVPNWSGAAHEEHNLIGDAIELDPSYYVNVKEGNPIKPLSVNFIGNWLQCRGVIEGVGEGVDGTVCAKWRRAPLFEVQTDNWECFNCVLWDPAHADCSVPQELDTDEVMKQLKYME